MAHFAIELFFGLVFIGVGVAAQLMLRAYMPDIMRALRFEAQPRAPQHLRVRAVRVTRRPRLAVALAAQRCAAAA